MKAKRITKDDLKGARVAYFHNVTLLDTKFDDFSGLFDAVARHIGKYGLNRIEISNANTGFFAEYSVCCQGGNIKSYRRLF